MFGMYQVRHPSRSEFVAIRSHSYHVRLWGNPARKQPPLFLLHGWMDVGASWQFVVDALPPEWLADRWVIAPDWRGFGLSRERHVREGEVPACYGMADHYFFADYLGDLDALIDHCLQVLGVPESTPVDLVGHSMGGNVVMTYGGVRPARVRRLINLEGFGMPASRPAQAPGRYARWLDELKALRQGELGLKAYDSLDGVARRLMKTNRRLGGDKAQWLASHWAAHNAEGQWAVLGDAAHKVISAQLYRLDEMQDVFRRITAPVLAVEASDDSLAQWYTQGEHTLAQYHERLQAVPDCRTAVVDDAGHMLHHDQPAAVARLIADFLR